MSIRFGPMLQGSSTHQPTESYAEKRARWAREEEKRKAAEAAAHARLREDQEESLAKQHRVSYVESLYDDSLKTRFAPSAADIVATGPLSVPTFQTRFLTVMDEPLIVGLQDAAGAFTGIQIAQRCESSQGLLGREFRFLWNDLFHGPIEFRIKLDGSCWISCGEQASVIYPFSRFDFVRCAVKVKGTWTWVGGK